MIHPSTPLRVTIKGRSFFAQSDNQYNKHPSTPPFGLLRVTIQQISKTKNI